MKQFDRTAEEQVWQRVAMREEVGQDRQELRNLILSAAEAAESYRYLAGILPGKGKERAKRLYEEEKVNIACLKGIRVLAGEGREKLAVVPPAKEPAARVLEKSYHRSRRALTEYTARSAQGEFGVVFHRLARREEEHCAVLAQLLGELEGR